MIRKSFFLLLATAILSFSSHAQSYPQNYFRSPLNIPLQLVANFGEIRNNHWHMGLDIRTQQRVNLPVYAAADGYIARVSVEPGGFGQAIYINHPNGYTTVYGHLNAFFPALEQYVKSRQYEMQSWKISIEMPAGMFPVNKGDFIALSGSTGASEGPHVHFEIRDTKTENCFNPLLFRFPLADAVPPGLLRLALYDRSISTYAQSPQIFALKKTGAVFTVNGGLIKTASPIVSFAIGAVDRFTGSANPNGIYSAAIAVDEQQLSSFTLDNISYNETRYINAQIDYPYKSRGGALVQHISPLPGATSVAYNINGDGLIHLPDGEMHPVTITVKDANGNASVLSFKLQYDEQLQKKAAETGTDKLLPNNWNIFERDRFELTTSDKTMYDTIAAKFAENNNGAANSVTPLFSFLSSSVPAHDSVTVRLLPGDIPTAQRNHVVIKNICGAKTFVQHAQWQRGWLSAKFRQFGTYQAFVDDEPPTINTPPSNVSRATRLVFSPKDNFNTIKSFRAEVDGQWLRFTNDKGYSWIYNFDDHFPKGEHQLKVIVEDEAGNITEKTWQLTR